MAVFSSESLKKDLEMNDFTYTLTKNRSFFARVYKEGTVTQRFGGFNEGRYPKHIIFYKNRYRHTEFKGNL